MTKQGVPKGVEPRPIAARESPKDTGKIQRVSGRSAKHDHALASAVYLWASLRDHQRLVLASGDPSAQLP